MTLSNLKLKFFGMVKAAAAVGTQVDITDASNELNVPVARLRTWTKEFIEAEQDENILKLLDVDELIVDKIAQELTEEASFLIDEETGTIAVEPRHLPSCKTTESFKDKVSGLQALSTELQGAAGTIANKIIKAAAEPDLTPRELKSLAEGITSIQNAFFNKPQTNVQVNMAVGENSLASKFKQNLKP